MKRYLTVLFAALFVCASVSAQSYGASTNPATKVIKVKNAKQFISAIGDNRIIEIDTDEPLNLTDALEYYAERGEIQEFEDMEGLPDGVYYYDNFDGKSIYIYQIYNLTIRAYGKNATLLSRPRYSDVLHFVECYGISLEYLTLGHTEEGYCEDGVLGLISTNNVSVIGCDLFGCGTEGVYAAGCSNVRFTGSTIRDCAYHIMHITGCEDLSFQNCAFYNNREFEQVTVFDNCKDISFDNCIFKGNQGPLFNIQTIVKMNNCMIQHSGNLGNTEKIRMTGTVISK